MKYHDWLLITGRAHVSAGPWYRGSTLQSPQQRLWTKLLQNGKMAAPVFRIFWLQSVKKKQWRRIASSTVGSCSGGYVLCHVMRLWMFGFRIISLLFLNAISLCAKPLHHFALNLFFPHKLIRPKLWLLSALISSSTAQTQYEIQFFTTLCRELHRCRCDFCWLALYPLEVHYASDTLLLFIVIIWHKSQQILTHTDVLKPNQIVKINCGCDLSVRGGDRDKEEGKTETIAKSKLIEMAP